MSFIQDPKAIALVSEFHTLFDAYTGDAVHIPEKKISDLRVSLIQEELNEFVQAIKDNDIVEIADALVDMQYVLSGAILAFGMQGTFADMFAEVHRSNMSKACRTKQEAEETVAYYKKERNTDAYIVEKEDTYIVHRTWDDKVLKSINYSPANLKQFFDK